MLVSIASKMISTEVTPGIFTPDLVGRTFAQYHYIAAISLNILVIISANHALNILQY